MTVIFPVLLLPASSHSKANPDPDSNRNACLQGVTIYCISVGMEEQKAGNDEQALEYFRLACESHSTDGHLQACTPYFSLAQEMGKLRVATAPMEMDCEEGNDILCFYLAKQYLRITAYEEGYRHLERLCEQDFKSPDADDYGPCYHFASSLQRTRNLERAKEIFKFDCDRNRALSKPSCNRYQTLTRQMAVGGGEERLVKKFQFKELALIPLVLLSWVTLVFYVRGGIAGLKFLRTPSPLIVFLCLAIWEFQPPQPVPPRTDLFFIVPSAFLALFFAAWSHLKLRAYR